jgi:5'-nucleotidase
MSDVKPDGIFAFRIRFLPGKALALVFVVFTLLTSTALAAAPSHRTVDIQILNVSDWHGQLDPLMVDGAQIGGAAVLAAYFQAERAANPNTLTLTAGDAVGATPPVSSFFGDVPAIEAMNLMGFQVDTLGNHNFDGGIAHLQGLIDIANFQYVSANLRNRDENLTGVKDFEIFDIGGVQVAVIGITNPEAPTLVFPGNFGTIVPTDPVKAAIKAARAAKQAGADIVIVICHMGVTGFDSNGAPFGPLIDFAKAVNKQNNKNPRLTRSSATIPTCSLAASLMARLCTRTGAEASPMPRRHCGSTPGITRSLASGSRL